MSLRSLAAATALLMLPLAAPPASAHLDDIAALRSATAGAKGGVDVEYYEFVPAVVAYNRSDTQPLVFRARVTGGGNGARLELSNGGGNVVMLDNGVAPDTGAGDGVFSAAVLPSVVLSRNTPERNNKPFIGFLQPLVNGVPTAGRYNVFSAVAAANLPAIPVISAIGGQTARRFTEYVVNYRDDQFAADFDMTRAAQRFYLSYPDAYEFMDFVWMPRNYIENRSHFAVRNATTGIGMPVFDTAAPYGSAARLIGVSQYPNLAFVGHSSGYVHELGHQWINFLAGSLDDTVGAHWPISPLAEDIMGFSGSGAAGSSLSCRLTLEAGGVRTAPRAQGTLYNFHELYLMGLATAAEVPASFTINDQTAMYNLVTGGTPWCNGQLLNVATTAVSASSIIGQNGARVPSTQNATRYFHVATVVISIGRELNDDEMRFLSEEARKVMQPNAQPYAEGFSAGVTPTFAEATRGRAALDTRLAGVFRNGFE